MKKIYLLLIIIFGIILIPLNTYALDFTVNNQTYTVNDLETYRDYCYFEKYKPNNSNSNQITTMLTYKVPWASSRWNCTTGYEYIWYDSTQQAIYSSDTLASERAYNYYIYNGTNLTDSFTNFYWIENINNLTDYYSTVNITDTSGNTLKSSNITFNDIECKYNTSDCVSGGGGGEEPPEPDEPIEEDNSNKNLLLVGLMLISIYIWLKFFISCFTIRKVDL